MPTIYAAPPGTGSGGSGTSGSPYLSMKTALEACSAGDTLILKTGTYTYSMAWNTVTWPSGSSGSVITVQPETFTPDTTRGIPAGTSSVIWRTTGGAALNFGVAGAGYWSFRGIDFDATNITAATFNYIVHNYANNNIEFRNCKFSNRAQTSGAITDHIEYANSIAQTTLRANSVRYCWFTNANTVATSHDIYCRMSGNIFEHNLFESGTRGAAIQFFASNGAGYNIQQNTVRFNEFKDYGNTASNNANILFSLNCSSNFVYGNLFYDSPTRIAIDFRGGSGISGDASGNVAAYNTIVNCLKGISISTSVSGFTNTIVKKNISYNNTTNYVDNGTGTVFTGNSTDGTDPVFTDSANDDYTLSAGSPAGLKANSVLAGSPYDDVDYVGATRDTTNPSIGAYEFDAAATPEPPINVVPNPAGFTTTVNTAVLMEGVTITDNNGTPLTNEAWLYTDANGTFTAVDTSGGATSVGNP